MIAGCLLAPRLALLGEALDAHDQLGVVSTFAPDLRADSPWRSQLLEGWVPTSVAEWPRFHFRCLLDSEGRVNIYGPGGMPDTTLAIDHAGVFREGAAGYGYVTRIRAIGDALYVCGDSRQVYRYVFDPSGPPLSGHFVDVAGDLRQTPMPPPTEVAGPEFEAWCNRSVAMFNDIDGIDEDDVYAVGDEAWHFDGLQWRSLGIGSTEEPLQVVKVVDAERVFIGGRNAYLYGGNAREGFTSLVGPNDNATITGVEWFDETLYVATDQGLFTLDAAARRLRPAPTGLTPELKDCRQLQAKEGVLWSFGYKDLAYLDTRQGSRVWVRVHHPDNPPVGSVEERRAAAGLERSRSRKPTADEVARALINANRSLHRWAPRQQPGLPDLGGLIRRVGHHGVGAFVVEQLAPLGMDLDQVLQFARTQRYELSIPQWGLALTLQFTGRKRALADPRAHPHLWSLAAVAIASAASRQGVGWQGIWPGRLNPTDPAWRRQAEQTWGEPGYRSESVQTHFVPGADGAALAIMLEHPGGVQLERMRVECLGEYVKASTAT